jgi:hypothetical protein
MAVDVSGVATIAPVLAYLIVAFVVGAVLVKFKILGENKWIGVIIALIIAALFVSFAGTRELVLTIIPWFAALIVSLFLILVVIAFVGGDADFMKKGVGIAAVVLLGIIFLVSAFVVFSEVIVQYIPGPAYGGGDSLGAYVVLDWLFSPRVWGAVLLVIFSVIAAWFLMKAK